MTAAAADGHGSSKQLKGFQHFSQLVPQQMHALEHSEHFNRERCCAVLSSSIQQEGDHCTCLSGAPINRAIGRPAIHSVVGAAVVNPSGTTSRPHLGVCVAVSLTTARDWPRACGEVVPTWSVASHMHRSNDRVPSPQPVAHGIKLFRTQCKRYQGTERAVSLVDDHSHKVVLIMFSMSLHAL